MTAGRQQSSHYLYNTNDKEQLVTPLSPLTFSSCLCLVISVRYHRHSTSKSTIRPTTFYRLSGTTSVKPRKHKIAIAISKV
mmetsp:Transcript_3650/g.8061  ORF Transcript_3650/g.8061 Transcript_3650/m.8061 type:complete len:81 (-) Transcript_3650:1533-1775(-)